MSDFTSSIIPAIQIIELLTDTKQFQDWLIDSQINTDSTEVFYGYKYAIVCNVNNIIYYIERDTLLGIENDYYFDRALSKVVPIHKIEPTCPKAVLLKKLKAIVKPISKSKNLIELERNVRFFQDKFTQILIGIYNTHVSIIGSISKSKLTSLNLINYVHIYLLQIGNWGPYANNLNTINPILDDENRMRQNLLGYALTVQYIISRIIPEDVYKASNITKLHLASSWREYKYIEDLSEDSTSKIVNTYFNLEEQNSVDSFFYLYSNEIVKKIELIHGVELLFIEDKFKFDINNHIDQSLFSHLVNSKEISNEFHKLTWDDKLDNQLYWHKIEVIDLEFTSIFFGAPSFNVMLMGMVSLFDEAKSEFDKPVVARFTHPNIIHNGNDFSYGILIDSNTVVGHSYSGWVIYQSVCSDYSGFSNHERYNIEHLVSKLLNDNKIKLRELTVPLKIFQKYTSQYSSTIKDFYRGAKERLEHTLAKKRELSAHYFELFVYYTLHREHKDDYRYSLNSGKKGIAGEMDVVLENRDNMILVECKLSLKNYDVNKVLQKIKKKLDTFPQKNKACQLWVWDKVSSTQRTTLTNHNIHVISINEHAPDPMLRGVDLSLLKRLVEI